jgi:hypothetical protein
MMWLKKFGTCQLTFNSSMFPAGGVVAGLMKVKASRSFTLKKLELTLETHEQYNSNKYNSRSRQIYHEYPGATFEVPELSNRYIAKGLDEMKFEMRLPEFLRETLIFNNNAAAHCMNYLEAVLHTDLGKFYYFDSIEFNLPQTESDAFQPKHLDLTPNKDIGKVTMDISLRPSMMRVGETNELTCEVKAPGSHSMVHAKVSLSQVMWNKNFLGLTAKDKTSTLLGDISLKTSSTQSLQLPILSGNFVTYDGKEVDNEVSLTVEAYKEGAIFGENSETKVDVPLKIGSKLVKAPIELSERFLAKSNSFKRQRRRALHMTKWVESRLINKS